MGWLPGFFDRKKTQNQQQPPTDSTTQNPAAQNPTTMLELVIEETIMTAAKWLVTFVNRSLEPKVVPIAEPQSTANPTNPGCTETPHSDTIETLLSKFGSLIEQSHDRTQQTNALEERLNQVEASLKQNNRLEQQVQELNRSLASLESRLINVEKLIQPIAQINQALTRTDQALEQHIQTSNQAITNLESRLTTAEDFVEQGHSLTTKITQTGQNLNILKDRVIHLEQLLARFSLIPRVVESNYRAIASLQNHVRSLNLSPDAYENHIQDEPVTTQR